MPQHTCSVDIKQNCDSGRTSIQITGLIVCNQERLHSTNTHTHTHTMPLIVVPIGVFLVTASQTFDYKILLVFVFNEFMSKLLVLLQMLPIQLLHTVICLYMTHILWSLSRFFKYKIKFHEQ